MSKASDLATRVLAPATALLLFAQAAIVVTGGAVRLTGSGLGCPTWPECTPGSYTPKPYQVEEQVKVWIEFGNRLLTFVLVLFIDSFNRGSNIIKSPKIFSTRRTRCAALSKKNRSHSHHLYHSCNHPWDNRYRYWSTCWRRNNTTIPL